MSRRVQVRSHSNSLEVRQLMEKALRMPLGKRRLARSLLHLHALVALIPLTACGGESPAGQEASRSGSSPPRPVQVTPVASIKSQKPLACPSKNFNAFLKEFANRIEVQRAFTLRPIKVKTPYYWRHNTEPGDPRYPKWLTETSKAVMPDIKYRYDAEKKVYVWDEVKLAEGTTWSSRGADGKARRVSPLPYFKVREVSGDRYEVDYIRSGTDSFVMRSGCWHFEGHWEREAIVDCKWPDECRKKREQGG
ncbi:hypothetical protein [Lysobacter sp. 1R34A]|uniref:hypothetical protein n=1 Tax=Lysobacter sp. 1R34A TaxID=3445786 RepID=UPI003EEE7B74